MNNLIKALKGEFDAAALAYNVNASTIKSDLELIRSVLHLTEDIYAIRMLRAILCHHYLSMKFSDIDADFDLRGGLPLKDNELEASISETMEDCKDIPELFDLMQEANTTDLFYLADSPEEQYAIIGYTITKIVNYA